VSDDKIRIRVGSSGKIEMTVPGDTTPGGDGALIGFGVATLNATKYDFRLQIVHQETQMVHLLDI